VHVVERSNKGIVISGTKAIVTAAPYMHEFSSALPQHDRGRRRFCRVLRGTVDAPGITIVARPPDVPAKLEHGLALFSRRYGQSTAVVIFDKVRPVGACVLRG
jgi:4-hydroxybutyryl-CoA dehydratase/vinylacetyl-CoA-Delta-isomerase